MSQWFDDEEVNRLLTQLMDRLCTLERMAGDSLESTLVFISRDKRYPILLAQSGKPFYPVENMTYEDVKVGVALALKARLKAGGG